MVDKRVELSKYLARWREVFTQPNLTLDKRIKVLQVLGVEFLLKRDLLKPFLKELLGMAIPASRIDYELLELPDLATGLLRSPHENSTH